VTNLFSKLKSFDYEDGKAFSMDYLTLAAIVKSQTTEALFEGFWFFADLSVFMNSEYFSETSKSKTLKGHTLKKMMTEPLIRVLSEKLELFSQESYESLEIILREID
jgi:hypothetical protein